MTHEIDMRADNVEELMEEAMRKFPYAAVRFLNNEVAELHFADTELELAPVIQMMEYKPGKTQFWGKAN